MTVLLVHKPLDRQVVLLQLGRAEKTTPLQSCIMTTVRTAPPPTQSNLLVKINPNQIILMEQS